MKTNWLALNELNALIRMLEAQTRYLTQALDVIEAEKSRALRLLAEMEPIGEQMAAIETAAKSAVIDAAATHPTTTTPN